MAPSCRVRTGQGAAKPHRRAAHGRATASWASWTSRTLGALGMTGSPGTRREEPGDDRGQPGIDLDSQLLRVHPGLGGQAGNPAGQVQLGVGPARLVPVDRAEPSRRPPGRDCRCARRGGTATPRRGVPVRRPPEVWEHTPPSHSRGAQSGAGEDRRDRRPRRPSPVERVGHERATDGTVVSGGVGVQPIQRGEHRLDRRRRPTAVASAPPRDPRSRAPASRSAWRHERRRSPA